jgi:TolB protein
VFSSSRSGDGDLLAIQPGTGELRSVVATPAPEGAPRYDPAGERLVHTRFSDEGGMVFAGGDPLFEDPNPDGSTSWSADGRIAWSEEEAGEDGEIRGDVFARPAAGGVLIRVTDDAEVERYPSWSPDGRRLAYARRLEGGWDVFVHDLDSGEATRVTFDGVYVGHLAWSPDGMRIAFDRMYGEETEIAVLDLRTGLVSRVTERRGNDLAPSWAPDGTMLAFAGDTDGNWEIWTVRLKDLGLVRLTEDPAFDGGPVFVPGDALWDQPASANTTAQSSSKPTSAGEPT